MRLAQIGVVAMVLFLSDGTRSGFAADEGNPNAPANVLDRITRKIGKEPNYTARPRYALIVLGTKAESKVWIVQDGSSLYVDKNANGDLTDDGPPIAPKNLRHSGTDDFVLDEIGPADGSRHTKFCLMRWSDVDTGYQYGLSLAVDGDYPMYAGWFSTFWAASPDAVPIVHFGGPLEPKMLRSREFDADSVSRRLSIAFCNLGRGTGAASRLSIDALPATVIPVAEVDWPVPDGSPPLRTSHPLLQRCCYWEFYTENFRVPQGAATGIATVKLTFTGGDFPFELTPNRIEVPVKAQ